MSARHKANDTLDFLAAAVTPAGRKRLYRIATGVVLILVLHKVVTAEGAATYLQALALALGVVPAELAARNVPSQK